MMKKKNQVKRCKERKKKKEVWKKEGKYQAIKNEKH